MATAALGALKKSIADGSFDPVYLFSGVEEFRKEEALRQAIGRAVEPALRDFNLDIVRGGDLSVRVLTSLLGTPPLMAPRRVVVIRDAGALKSPVRAVLDRYLATPAVDVTVFMLVTPEDEFKLDNELRASVTEVEFTPLSQPETLKWIGRHLATIHGTSITAGAATLLGAAAGSDLPLLASELDKLASYTAAGVEIDEAAVNEIVGIEKGKTVPDLLDAVAVRDTRSALPLVSQVLAYPKLSGVLITMMLTSQMLGIAYARARLDQGMQTSQLDAELFSLMRGAKGMPPVRPWKESVRCWVRGVAHWSESDIRSAMEALLRADTALKETRVSSDEDILNGLILALSTSGSSTSHTGKPLSA